MPDPSGVRTTLPISEWTKDRPYLRGTWYAHRLRRGVHTRRPHYYVWSPQTKHYDWASLCGFSTRHDQDLVVDPDTGFTMEIDPLIGDYQMRRLCGHCVNILEPGPTTNEIVQAIAASWTMVPRA